MRFTILKLEHMTEQQAKAYVFFRQPQPPHVDSREELDEYFDREFPGNELRYYSVNDCGINAGADVAWRDVFPTQQDLDKYLALHRTCKLTVNDVELPVYEEGETMVANTIYVAKRAGNHGCCLQAVFCGDKDFRPKDEDLYRVLQVNYSTK